MADFPNQPDAGLPEPDRDVLISRVVDGRASGAEWAHLESLAARDSSVWREIAIAQRDQRAIEMIVGAAGDLAESVDLPFARPENRRASSLQRMRTWGGWAVAAALAFAIVGQYRGNSRSGAHDQTAGPNIGSPLQPVAYQTPDQALEYYRNEGRKTGVVLGEMPDQVLLAAEPAPDGQGYVVMFVRQLVERRQVKDVVGFHTRDELGKIVSVPRSVQLRRPPVAE